MDVSSIYIEDITTFKEYHGLHVFVNAYIDKTKIPLNLDIGFGDVVYPNIDKIIFPVLLDMEEPKINSYPLATTISEKIEAIVHNGYLNSRYKDFTTFIYL